MSRSPSIVMAYLMYKFQWTLKKAYIHVITRRQCIRPNISFLQQLWQYENVIFGEDFEHSVQYKDLRGIMRLYKKWQKELQRKGAAQQQINRDAIIQINGEMTQEPTHDLSNDDGDINAEVESKYHLK